jgi:hypothetical protein
LRGATLVREGRPSRTPMEIFNLIDRLDDLIHEAKPVPLTNHVRVDKQDV